jgi:hypothetical protein
VFVAEWPSMEAAKAWYDSPGYQAIRPPAPQIRALYYSAHRLPSCLFVERSYRAKNQRPAAPETRESPGAGWGRVRSFRTVRRAMSVARLSERKAARQGAAEHKKYRIMQATQSSAHISENWPAFSPGTSLSAGSLDLNG